MHAATYWGSGGAVSLRPCAQKPNTKATTKSGEPVRHGSSQAQDMPRAHPHTKTQRGPHILVHVPGEESGGHRTPHRNAHVTQVTAVYMAEGRSCTAQHRHTTCTVRRSHTLCHPPASGLELLRLRNPGSQEVTRRSELTPKSLARRFSPPVRAARSRFLACRFKTPGATPRYTTRNFNSQHYRERARRRADGGVTAPASSVSNPDKTSCLRHAPNAT